MGKNEDFRRKVFTKQMDFFTDLGNDYDYILEIHPDIGKETCEKDEISYLSRDCNSNLLESKKNNEYSIVSIFDKYKEKKSNVLLNLLFHPAFLVNGESNKDKINCIGTTMYFIKPTEANINTKMRLKSY